MFRLIIFIVLAWDAPSTGPVPDGYTVYWAQAGQAEPYHFDILSTRCRVPALPPFAIYWVTSWIERDGKRIESEPCRTVRKFLIGPMHNYNWRRTGK